MKKNLAGVMVGLAVFAAAPAALAQPAQSGPVCIQGYNIMDSERPNDHTIIFDMKDGSKYQVNTVGACPGLAAAPNGFTFSPTDPGSDEYCSNLVTIRVNGPGQMECLLGAFVRIK